MELPSSFPDQKIWTAIKTYLLIVTGTYQQFLGEYYRCCINFFLKKKKQQSCKSGWPPIRNTDARSIPRINLIKSVCWISPSGPYLILGYFIMNYHVNIKEGGTSSLYLCKMHVAAVYTSYFWNTTILFPHFEVLAYFIFWNALIYCTPAKTKSRLGFGGML